MEDDSVGLRCHYFHLILSSFMRHTFLVLTDLQQLSAGFVRSVDGVDMGMTFVL